jgi:hypothetical protein
MSAEGDFTMASDMNPGRFITIMIPILMFLMAIEELTPALLGEPPGIVCLLADATRLQINSPILSCPARQTA